MTSDSPKQMRTREIKIRFTPDEYEQAQHLCTRAQLAPWIRQLVLNPTADWVNSEPRKKAANPELLRGLASIGNNLNQMTKAVNSGDWGISERVSILARLRGIEAELQRIRADHDAS
jgi:predicted chitinase